MPPKAPLPAEAVAVLTEWVKIGAAVPATTPRPSRPPTRRSTGRSSRSRSRRCRRRAEAPADRNPIDALRAGEAERQGLSPAPRADQRTLIRRAYFDLIGLPPTAEEVEAFEKDDVARRVREADRPAARVAAVRRAVGPALARRRPLRRHQGVRLPGGPELPVRLHLPRLRHPRVQRGQAVRPVRHRATRRRPARRSATTSGRSPRWGSSPSAGGS